MSLIPHQVFNQTNAQINESKTEEEMLWKLLFSCSANFVKAELKLELCVNYGAKPQLVDETKED